MPELKINLFSVPSVTKKGYKVTLSDEKCQAHKNNNLCAVGVREGNFYVMNFIYLRGQVKKGDEMKRVCKTQFLNTFCIGKTCVWSWKAETKENHPTNEQVPETRQKPFDKEVKTLHDFLDQLPKKPSHYCRKRTQLYLQPDIASKKQLYDLYSEHCKSLNTKPLSIATFSNSLTMKKKSLFKPKKDLCDTCNGHKLGHVSDEVYEEHINKKN